MSSQQLNDLGLEELEQHSRRVYDDATAALAATPMDAREDIKATRNAAWERADWAKAAAETAAEVVKARPLAWASAREAATAARARAAAIANLDILHRQQMMGDWSDDINEAYIQDRIYETRPDVIKAKKDKETQMKKAKKETKEHMGSMLGDWDKAGKLIKRHTSKNRKKTKRRKQKIAKRIRGTKRR